MVPASLYPPSFPGDIYLDISEPYRVWVHQQNGWVEWISMARTAEVPHPTMNRIILPTVQRFSWVASSSIRHHTDILMNRLGGRTDSAETHVAIILNGESHSNSSYPKRIPQLRAISPQIDQSRSSSLSNLSSSPDDTTPPRRSSDSMMSIEGPPTIPFDDRLHSMRAENTRIRGLIESSPRVSSTCCHYCHFKFIHVIASHRFISGLEGTEFPIGTETISWPAHDILTFKPFTQSNGNDKVSIP